MRHLVYSRYGGEAATNDPVLAYDAAAARTSTESADAVVTFVRERNLRVAWKLASSPMQNI